MSKKETDDIKRSIRKKTKRVKSDLEKIKEPVHEPSPLLIPTGSTNLNLCLCDKNKKSYGGFSAGTIVNIVGDSGTSKTMLSLSIFGEMANSDKFDDYELHFDDVEQAFAFDLEYLFGKKTAKRVNLDHQSDTIEELFYHLIDLAETGKPFVYIVDSVDALDAKENKDYVDKLKKAHEENKEAKGTFAQAKNKKLKQLMQRLVGKIRESNSLIIFISQTIADLNPMTRTQKTRACANILEFFSSHVVWLARKKKIDNTVKSVKYIIGADVIAKVSKNKLTGKKRETQFTVFEDYGVDDITSMLNFLVNVGVWSTSKQSVKTCGIKTAKFPELILSRKKLITTIEEKGYYGKMKKLVKNVHHEMESSVKLGRKRYE